MKKVIILLLLVFIGATSQAQQISVTCSMDNKTMTSEAKTGHFQWKFPSTTTLSSIENTAKYYAPFFTYKFDEKTGVLDINSINDGDETRKIMLRFLGANQVNEIKVGEISYKLYEYYDSYLKKTE